VLPAAPAVRPTLSLAAITMQENPGVQYDNDMSGWKPDAGTPDMEGKALHAGDFSSTDTPDFFYEDGDNAEYGKDISTMDGVMGSSVQNVKKERSNNPGVAGALDVNPDITYYAEELTDVSQVDFGLSTDIKMTDLDFEMTVDSTLKKTMTIDVRPVMMTYEEFYCGFTKDSHPGFSCTPSSGKMEKRGGTNTQIDVTIDPKGQSGELKGTLCFILPEEKAFSTYYEIVAKSF